ncbi:MAG: single-stranded-DNA-specific exonuclease RecJ [Clostridium sp.]
MKEKWLLTGKKKEYESLVSEYQDNQLILRLLANRGICTKKEATLFLNGDLDDLRDGRGIIDMEKGVSIIKEAIIEKKLIAIYGDYDCDGVTSTTILYKTLKSLDANFLYYIPNREEEGYGMHSDRVRKLKQIGVEVILTCDNGIAAFDQVALAKELGMKVVITDHHDIPFEERGGERVAIMPIADAVINPKREDCTYPFKDLCGAGVAFKFSKCLIEELNGDMELWRELVEIAAIGTVCDVVNLLDENRIIVKSGLKVLNSTNNIGLKELIKATELSDKEISEYHLGFVIGPCINATGRLETADLSVKLLVSEDEKEASELAKQLHGLNSIRQELTQESTERVLLKLEEELKPGEKVILVYDGEIHESIAGIVAGRVREKFNLPAIVMTKGKDCPKGSARSIEEYNMFEELSKCKEHIEKFGGHPMAAGLSVKEDNLLNLRNALLKNCTLTEEDIMPKVKIDSALSIESVSEGLINEIDRLKPFGKGNPSPVLASKNIKITRVWLLGKEKRILKFRLQGNNGNIDGICFDKFDMFKEMFEEKYGEENFLKLYDNSFVNFNMDIIFYPSINEFNGKRTVQLVIKNLRI